MLNTGTGRENLGTTCQSNLNRVFQTFENEVPWFHLLCFAHCRKQHITVSEEFAVFQ